MTSTITLTGILATWGAVVATLVLVWDIYKWKTSGHRIVLTASTHENGPTFYIVTATNVGDQPSTLMGFNFKYYPNWWKCLQRKHDLGYHVKDTGFCSGIHQTLAPGAVWTCEGKDERAGVACKKGIVIFELTTSHSKRAIRVRVKDDKIY